MKRKHIFEENEQVITTVSRKVFLKMLEIARDFDLDKGGVYDARSSAINCWCSPQDKPSDFSFEITKGALNYPREFLATIYGHLNLEKDEVTLFLIVRNYARQNYAQMLLDESEISYEQYKHQKQLSEQGTEPEWQWAKQKAQWLIDLAQKEQVFQTVLCCPYCGKKDFQLFNDLISCIVSHGVEIKAIILGKGIQTSKGLLTEQDYTTTIKE